MIIEHGPAPLKGGVTTLMHVGEDEAQGAPGFVDKVEQILRNPFARAAAGYAVGYTLAVSTKQFRKKRHVLGTALAVIVVAFLKPPTSGDR